MLRLTRYAANAGQAGGRREAAESTAAATGRSPRSAGALTVRRRRGARRGGRGDLRILGSISPMSGSGLQERSPVGGPVEDQHGALGPHDGFQGLGAACLVGRGEIQHAVAHSRAGLDLAAKNRREDCTPQSSAHDTPDFSMGGSQCPHRSRRPPGGVSRAARRRGLRPSGKFATEYETTFGRSTARTPPSRKPAEVLRL